MRNVANVVTFARILGVGVLVLFFAPFDTFCHQVFSIRLYWTLVITDTIDGRLARSRFGRVTTLGKMLDPVADKLLFLIFLPLIWMGAIHPLPVIVLLARDIIIDNLLRNFAAQKGIVIAARISGKIKTIVAFIVIGVLLCRVAVTDMPDSGLDAWIVGFVQGWPSYVVSAMIWSLAIIAIVSGVDYLFFNRRVIFDD